MTCSLKVKFNVILSDTQNMHCYRARCSMHCTDRVWGG